MTRYSSPWLTNQRKPVVTIFNLSLRWNPKHVPAIFPFLCPACWCWLVLRLLNLAGVRLITIVRPFPQGLPASPGQVSGRLPFLESVCSALLLQAWSTRLVRTYTHHCGHLKLLKAQLSCALCDKVLSSCNLEQMFILWFLKHCFSYSSWKEVFSFANTFLCRPQINNSIRLINISFVQTKNYIDPTWYIAFCGSSSTRDQSLTGLANRTF